MTSTDTPEVLDDLVRVSRQLGSRSDLVLHGGGNTSTKARITDVFGDTVDIVYVKGSGWDLASIEPAGFAPLRMDRLRSLLRLPALSDSAMVNELRLASLDASSPDASVEALVHGLLPAPVVLHTHADAIVTLTNLADGEKRVRDLFGDRLIVVPYVMPGFLLAKSVADLWATEAGAATEGLLLLNHGLFTVGATADEAYERHIAIVTQAEEYIQQAAGTAGEHTGSLLPCSESTALEIARLRAAVSAAAGVPMILRRTSDATVARFVERQDLALVSQQGPLTPDHVIRIKRLPLIGRDVAGYTAEYRAYFSRLEASGGRVLTPLSPEPRVILDRELGMLTAGKSPQDSVVAAEVYEHTMSVIEKASRIGEYRALSEEHIFAVEYWELEQAKLARENNPKPFRGEIAVVTGAASGIGRACAEALLASGAAVIGLDRDPSVATTFTTDAWIGVPVDVTDVDSLRLAVAQGVERFGGIDMLVLCAGIFAASAPIAELTLDSWRKSMAVNAESVVTLMQIAHPFLKLAPDRGRVVLIASKNVAAPGPGAVAYSASKTAAAQVARVAALEWAEDGITVNMVHPDAVFDTALWTPELVAARAAKYGLTEAQYKTRNLLHAEVTSARVASVVELLCSPQFDCTTGAQIPIDGGNERVI